MHLHFVSIYWLYLSCYYFYELPLEVFETFNLPGQRDERGRIKDLLVSTLRTDPEWRQIYAHYKERWNKIVERRQMRESKAKEEEEKKEKEIKKDQEMTD